MNINKSNATLSTNQPEQLIPAKQENTTVLQRVESVLDYCLKAAMIFTGLGLAVLMFTQVVMRYLLDSPFAGIEEAAILLALWTYFLGMGYATKQRAHIHGGIVSLVVSDPIKIQWIRFFGSIVCTIAACLFGYFATKYGLFVIAKGRMSLNMHWPKGLWSASMIFGFAMMSGFFVLQTIKDFREVMMLKRQANASSHNPIITEKD
jgi:TRAP-type C4-dicarboxylate transport system permease small subunit